MKLSPSNWQRIRRTPYQALASIFMISITLLVLSVFVISGTTLSSILSYFETKPQVTVFFKEDKDKSTIDQLISKLKTSDKISSIKFISKEEALRIYQEQNKNDPLLLEMVTADILPASIEIYATNPKFLPDIVENVKKEPGVDEVVFQKEIVDTLVSWTTTIRKVGIVFFILLLVASFIIIVTTIGLKIAYRKNEIEILKLVGATPWYIKKPFIVEGSYYGMIGATFSWILTSCTLLYLQPFMSSFLQGIQPLNLMKINGLVITLWPPHIVIFLLLFILLQVGGLLIGFTGSLFAVSRYMKY